MEHGKGGIVPKLFNKLGNLGNSSKADQSDAERERGAWDKKLADSCYKKETFQELKGREQELFFRYLRGGVYPEKEDITSVESSKLKGLSRTYQFWLKCEEIELLKEKLIKDYISPEDDNKRLPEVNECLSKGEDIESLLREEEGFIKKIKGKVVHALEDKFKTFRETLVEKCKNDN